MVAYLSGLCLYSSVEMRKALHSRLGLPLDRPLLRTANALNFGMKSMKTINPLKYGIYFSFLFLNLLCIAALTMIIF